MVKNQRRKILMKKMKPMKMAKKKSKAKFQMKKLKLRSFKLLEILFQFTIGHQK